MLLTKKELAQEVLSLEWGDVIYGYLNGNLININKYNEKKDLFGGYDDNGYRYYTYDELKSIDFKH